MMEGVTVHPLKHIVVPKGDIYHALKSTDEGAAKGWKRHNRMTLNLVVPVGAVKFVIYDDREGSPTRGQFEEITLSPESCYQRLTVAPGLWMAFYGEGEGISMLMDIIPEPHDPSEASRMELEAIDYKF